MSQALVCDRCGSFYTKNDANKYDNQIIIEPKGRRFYSHIAIGCDQNWAEFDLCPKCAKLLEFWINELVVKSDV